MPKTFRVLAIDPGYERLGIAVLERGSAGASTTSRDTLLYSDCFQTSAKEEFSDRLVAIGVELARVIHEYRPGIMAIESLFLTNNHKTAMRVAEVRGVLMYEARRAKLTIVEYTPPEIKMATTGYGKSDKKHMIFMIPKLIRVTKEIRHDDEYDAIATGITCLALHRTASYSHK